MLVRTCASNSKSPFRPEVSHLGVRSAPRCTVYCIKAGDNKGSPAPKALNGRSGNSELQSNLVRCSQDLCSSSEENIRKEDALVTKGNTLSNTSGNGEAHGSEPGTGFRVGRRRRRQRRRRRRGAANGSEPSASSDGGGLRAGDPSDRQQIGSASDSEKSVPSGPWRLGREKQRWKSPISGIRQESQGLIGRFRKPRSEGEAPITKFGFRQGFLEKFDLEEVIGRGTFGTVSIAVDRETGERGRVHSSSSDRPFA